jgi:hypothetical protein
MTIPPDDLGATCAFLATYLAGRPAWVLRDGGQPRDFAIVWLNPHLSCVWDSQRLSYVHLQGGSESWQGFDVASGHWLRIDQDHGDGYDFTFRDASDPAWYERVGLAAHEAHTSGTEGEHCYGFDQPSTTSASG